MRYALALLTVALTSQIGCLYADKTVPLEEVPADVKSALTKLAANEGAQLEAVSMKEGGVEDGLYVGTWHVGNNMSQAEVSASGVFAAMDQSLTQNDLPPEIQAMVKRIFPEKVPSDVVYNRRIAVSYEIDFTNNGTKKSVQVSPAGKLLKVDASGANVDGSPLKIASGN